MNKGMRILAWTALGLMCVLIFGLITMLLWNWLVPVLFSGPVISFWQALGLLVLSKLLFWGASGKGHHWGSHRDYQNHWKNKFYNKFSSMTPEEREALKQKMKEKWCHWESGPSKDSAASND